MIKEESEFISLVSDTTFKYLYKNIKTGKWIIIINKNDRRKL